jgi:hypothetical protein
MELIVSHDKATLQSCASPLPLPLPPRNTSVTGNRYVDGHPFFYKTTFKVKSNHLSTLLYQDRNMVVFLNRDLQKPVGYKADPTKYELAIMKYHYVQESIKGFFKCA